MSDATYEVGDEFEYGDVDPNLDEYIDYVELTGISEDETGTTRYRVQRYGRTGPVGHPITLDEADLDSTPRR